MWPLLPTWRELREGPGNGLQGGEVIVLSSMQSLVTADITMCKHLLASGAHVAVQACLPGTDLPCTLLLLGLGAGRPLSALEVRVCGQKFLLLGCIRQEHEQLIEDLLEVLPEQVPATLIILGCGDHALPPRARPSHTWPRPGPHVAGYHRPLHPTSLTCLNSPEWLLNSLKRVSSLCRKSLMDWMSCKFLSRKFSGTR